MEQLRYLGMIVTSTNFIQEEIKWRLNSGNACYHSDQNLLSSRLISKNVKIETCKTITLPVVVYGCETWPLALRAFESRVLRRIFDWKRNAVVGGLRKVHNDTCYI
jgi:hypothetical protein